ncbi:MAG: response regulator [Proteobacteria bacterium]|nr:response regulator [Pseudomonadota bacterium]
MKKSKTKTLKVALIVDDEKIACSALSFFLKRHFDEVLMANDPADAEALLNKCRVTHLICDHWLGAKKPMGIDLVSKWRKQYPSINCAVILTGADVSSLCTDASVDKVLSKAAPPELLLSSLLCKQ